MPAQLPVAAIISRSKLVRCSSRCASSSLPSAPAPSAAPQLVRIAPSPASASGRASHSGCWRRPSRSRLATFLPVSGSNSTISSISSPKKADPPGGVLIVDGKISRLSPRTRKLPRAKAWSLRLYCSATSLRMISRWSTLAALLQAEDHRRIGLDRADAVEAGDRGDDDHVVALQQRPGGRVAHPVDRLVHRAFLLDVGVGARDVGFGLVVIVVADEIFDRIVGEEALELAVELRGQDLVGRQDQRRALQRLDDLAMVKVLPEPVTPSSTWSSRRLQRLDQLRIAVGWSPAGS
jgi:hypothetical protein